jgi:CheY-like chemotaxis protein
MRENMNEPNAVQVEMPLQRPILLLVDDDRTVHSIAERILSDFAGTILHAYDGREALNLARETHPDLIITDALLPLLDGRELARTLKADADPRLKSVVVMTALYKGARYRCEAFREFQVDAYVEKPIRPERLRAIVETALPAVRS